MKQQLAEVEPTVKVLEADREKLIVKAALDAVQADLWRWWLIANAPETADVDFQSVRFASDVSKDLANVFGNLVQRVTRFAQAAFDGRVPAEGEPSEIERALAADVSVRVAETSKHREAREFRRAAAETRALWARRTPTCRTPRLGRGCAPIPPEPPQDHASRVDYRPDQAGCRQS